MTEPTADSRTAILDLMKIIANEEQQLDFEKAAPPQVNITEEIFVLWFNELYRPDDPAFACCFNQDELSDLAEFNQYLKDRKQHLPDSHGTIHTWLSNPVWREIMQKAQKTLERIQK